MVCPLCQVKLVASSEEECIAHMASCTGFQARHPANVDGTSQSLGQNAAGSSAGSGMAGGGGASATTHAGYYVPGEDVVVLQGLEARPELNGKLAVVLGWHMSRGRWGVEILPSGVEGGTDAGTDGAQMRIRPKNLRWAGRISAGLGSTVLVEEASVECAYFIPPKKNNKKTKHPPSLSLSLSSHLISSLLHSLLLTFRCNGGDVVECK